ncbi:DUF1998 domain-containing protein [Hoyosella sp. G463]|uniref:DUF1998 domain-containing protein n=1 Tax=Lolliginicoccus lacisalsi TaxID=2742202 RepID=A0A927JDC7_9ACTN|nr:DEAD/DEAH box helicase [Lolliginicoccus lacisalsi]MBD8507264.1 DUF1998 domain-containing protein [Lolliginicoccus lacisalsi]
MAAHGLGDDLLAAIADRSPSLLTGAPTHIDRAQGRPGIHEPWPDWTYPGLRDELIDRGITSPYAHQVEAASLARSGQHVVLATGTSSGKSLAYLLPALTALAEQPRATALYLSPTKALGADQLRATRSLTGAIPGLASAGPHLYDGDTPTDHRRWIRDTSRLVFTNPDMLHVGILPNHPRWSRFLRGLSFVIIDECHHYRGVFGSHVAWTIRRLRRIAARYGSHPVFVLASATTANPAEAATRLIGADCRAVTEDAAPRGHRTTVLWEPGPAGTGDPTQRNSPHTEAALFTAALVEQGARTLMFVRSRAGAEHAAMMVRERLGPPLAGTVAAYRAGYLPEDRRRLEAALASGELRAVATTNALELGIDIAGLDAVVLTGFPGTVASFRQQAGRSGRRGQGALVVLVARDDPLDNYLIHNPGALLDKPVEATVTNPANPYIAAPQVMCAATELPITDDEVTALGITGTIADLAGQGFLRRRPRGWFPAPGIDAHGSTGLRGTMLEQVVIVESATGRLLGTVDASRAPATVHPGAVHLHQGEVFVVDDLDLDEGIARVTAGDPGYTTVARSVSDIRIAEVLRSRQHGPVTVGLARVDVTSRITNYLRRGPGGEVLATIELDMPESTLPTVAAAWTHSPGSLGAAGIADEDIPGALHAAEHAAIGLLPLFASCDRNDIGGVSTALHPDTGMPSVFVYDGHPGGAGTAEHGHDHIRQWLAATRATIRGCRCRTGCPSCVQSPKCGNGNEPLDKAGAVRVLSAVLDALG